MLNHQQLALEDCHLPKAFKGCVANFCHPKIWSSLPHILAANPKAWGTVGFHPKFWKLSTPYRINTVMPDLIASNRDRVVAVGEVGLDSFQKKHCPLCTILVMCILVSLALFPNLKKEKLLKIWFSICHLLLETDAPLIWHERVNKPIIPNPGHVLYQAMSVSELTGRKLVDVCNQTTYIMQCECTTCQTWNKLWVWPKDNQFRIFVGI